MLILHTWQHNPKFVMILNVPGPERWLKHIPQASFFLGHLEDWERLENMTQFWTAELKESVLRSYWRILLPDKKERWERKYHWKYLLPFPPDLKVAVFRAVAAILWPRGSKPEDKKLACRGWQKGWLQSWVLGTRLTSVLVNSTSSCRRGPGADLRSHAQW